MRSNNSDSASPPSQRQSPVASSRTSTPLLVSDDCVICLEPLSHPATALPCQHSTFDLLCLLTWLEHIPATSLPRCPLCNSAISSVCYDELTSLPAHKQHESSSSRSTSRQNTDGQGTDRVAPSVHRQCNGAPLPDGGFRVTSAAEAGRLGGSQAEDSGGQGGLGDWSGDSGGRNERCIVGGDRERREPFVGRGRDHRHARTTATAPAIAATGRADTDISRQGHSATSSSHIIRTTDQYQAVARQLRGRQSVRQEDGWNRHRASTNTTPATRLRFRRSVYEQGLYSLHVGSNRTSAYREGILPRHFVESEVLVSKARTWIRRELGCFSFLNGEEGGLVQNDSSSRNHATARGPPSRGNAEFLHEYIIAILKTVDMQGSAGQAQEMIGEFLGKDNARLFLHELRSWLRSPYDNLEAWDRHVQYPVATNEDGAEHGTKRRVDIIQAERANPRKRTHLDRYIPD